MKKKLFLFVLLVNTYCYSQTPSFDWVKTIGGAGQDFGYDIKKDSYGNLYSTGTFSGIADFDPSNNIYNMTSNGGYDAYIAKYDSNGVFLWAKQFGSVGDDRGFSIAIDSSSNIYTAGFFTGTADFDPNSGVYNLSSGGIFFSKLDSLGNFLWAKNITTTFIYNDGVSICTDNTGNIYATGYFSGTVDFDPGIGVFNLTTGGLTGGPVDVFIYKLDSLGNFGWAKSISGSSNSKGSCIKIDNHKNIFVTGHFSGVADFDTGPTTNNITASSTDIFIQKLDSLGNYQWTRTFGGQTSTGYGKSISIDESGNIYAVGVFTNTVDFNPSPNGVFNLSSGAAYSTYILKLNNLGNFIYAKMLSGSGGFSIKNWSDSFEFDKDGNLLIAGYFIGTTDFNPGTLIYNLTSTTNAYNIFVLKLDSLCNFISAIKIGGNTNGQLAKAITLDEKGSIYVTGYFSGTVDFDPGPNSFIVSNFGTSDIFILKLNNCSSIFSPIITGNTTICSNSNTTLTASAGGTDANTTYSWSGPNSFSAATSSISSINVAGVYTCIISNGSGCSASTSSTLTVNPLPTASTISASSNTTFCAGDSVTLIGNSGGTWSNNDTTSSINVTSAGTYSVTNTNSCGSITSNSIVVTVNPLPIVSISTNDTICNNTYLHLQADVNDSNCTFSWSNPMGFTNSSQSFTIQSPGTNFSAVYSVLVTNQHGCSTITSQNVIVNAISDGVWTGDATCPNSTDGWAQIHFGSQYAPDYYIWSNGATTQLISNLLPGSYSVNSYTNYGCQHNTTFVINSNTQFPTPSLIVANSSTSICQGDSVIIEGNNNGTWNTNSIDFNITAIQPGIYYVINSNICGSDTSNSIEVTLNQPPVASTISAIGNTTFCEGDSVTLIGNSGGSWSNNDTASTINVTIAGNYSVTNTNSCGSAASNSIVITVNPLPTASTISAGGNTTFCSGDSVTLSGNTGGVWSNNATIASITLSNSGNYFVTNQNSCDTVLSNIISITVNDLPNTGITQNNDTLTSNEPNGIYQWFDCTTQTIIAGGTAQSYTPTMPGSYGVVIQTQNGCIDTSGCYQIILTAFSSNGQNSLINIAIYPNPTNSEITISNILGRKIEIENTIGEIIFSKQNSSYSEIIDFSSFSDGIYIIKMSNDNEVVNRKIIKQ